MEASAKRGELRVEFLSGLLSNVTANLVFWLLLGAVVTITVRLGQRRFRRFFGCDNVARLTSCLSNLWSPSASSRPIGYTVSLHEMRAAENVNRLFASASFRLPDLVRGLVDAVWLGSYPIEYKTDVSPAMSGDPTAYLIDRGNIVVLGGARRNSIRALYLTENSLLLKLRNEAGGEFGTWPVNDEDAGLEVLAGAQRGEILPCPSGKALAVIERIHDQTRGYVAFFCFGYRADTTWAATEHLLRNWRRLQSEFGNAPFAIGLAFTPLNYGYSPTAAVRVFTLRP